MPIRQDIVPNKTNILRLAPGVGKSTVCHKEAACEGTRSLSVFKSHKQLQEALKEFEKHTGQKAESVSLPFDDEHCRRAGEASRCYKLGYSPAMALCPSCRFRKKCVRERLRESAKQATHKFCTAAHAIHQIENLAKECDLVVVHEDDLIEILQPQIQISSTRNLKFMLADIDEAITKEIAESSGENTTSDEGEAEQEPGKPYNFEKMLKTLRLLRSNLKKLHLACEGRWFEDVEVEADTEWIEIDEQDNEVLCFGSLGFMNISELFRYLFYHKFEINEEIKESLNGLIAFTSGDVDRVTPVHFGKTRSGDCTILVHKKRRLDRRTVLNADSTCDLELVKRIAPDAIDLTPEVEFEKLYDVIHVVGADVTKNMVNGKPMKALGILEEALRLCNVDGEFDLISHRDFTGFAQERYSERLGKFECFFGAESRGSNSFADEASTGPLIVLGTPRIHQSKLLLDAVRFRYLGEARNVARAMRKDEFLVVSFQRTSEDTKTGELETFSHLDYKDPVLKKLANQYTLAEIIQSAGRARVILDEGRDVIVVSPYPLPLHFTTATRHLVKHRSAQKNSISNIEQVLRMDFEGQLKKRGITVEKFISVIEEAMKASFTETTLDEVTSKLDGCKWQIKPMSAVAIADKAGIARSTVDKLSKKLQRSKRAFRFGMVRSASANSKGPHFVWGGPGGEMFDFNEFCRQGGKPG